MLKTDDIGSIDIPDKNSYYYVLTSTTLNLLSSRRNQITKTVDVIDLNGVKDITTRDNGGEMVFTGGVE